MSHPNPSHDRENEYPSDDYKPVRKKYAKEAQKKEMAKKMTFHPQSIVGKLASLVNESANLRKNPMGIRKPAKKKTSPFKRYSAGADLPPGYRDSDNE